MNQFTERRGSGLVLCALVAFTIIYALLLIAAVRVGPVHVGQLGRGPVMVHTYGASGRCWECGETRDGVPIPGYINPPETKKDKKRVIKLAKRAAKRGY